MHLLCLRRSYSQDLCWWYTEEDFIQHCLQDVSLHIISTDTAISFVRSAQSLLDGHLISYGVLLMLFSHSLWFYFFNLTVVMPVHKCIQ
jgi:hypothetical protein